MIQCVECECQCVDGFRVNTKQVTPCEVGVMRCNHKYSAFLSVCVLFLRPVQAVLNSSVSGLLGKRPFVSPARLNESSERPIQTRERSVLLVWNERT